MGGAPRQRLWPRLLVTASLCGAAFGAEPAAAAPRVINIAPSAWRIAPSQSGPTNYFSVSREAGTPFIRASYQWPMKTAVFGWEAPEHVRESAQKLSWSWRALALPRGGDECARGKSDSAAVVYVTWKRGLRFYTLKYVWSSGAAKGRVCEKKRNPFVAQDTVILESGPPLNTWRSVELDLRAEFRKHFHDGDPNAEVANFAGIGLMSDGDQTQSASSADYASFSLGWND